MGTELAAWPSVFWSITGQCFLLFPFVPCPILHAPSSVDSLYVGDHSWWLFPAILGRKTSGSQSSLCYFHSLRFEVQSMARFPLQTYLEFCCPLPLSIGVRTIIRGPRQWPVFLFKFPLSFSISWEIFSVSLWARESWLSKVFFPVSALPHPLKYSFGTLFLFIYLFIIIYLFHREQGRGKGRES